MNLDEINNLENEDSTTSNVVVFDAPKSSENQENVNQVIDNQENNIVEESKVENTQEPSKDNSTQEENNDENEKTKVVPIVVSANDLQKFENSSAYKIKLENFEGPLDLLLYLIKDSKAEIEDIKLADITDQYLEYMKDLDSIDMETAAEFIDIAATLLEIKSKHLLPQEQEIKVDEQDDEQLLLMRLKEYKLFKEASEKLKLQENVDRLYRVPDEKVNDFRIILKQMNVENLISAFTKMLSRASIEVAVEETKTIERDRWTVEEKEFEIRTLVTEKGALKFSEIVTSDFTRGEIITTFMALLEMLKRQEIEVTQDEQFGEITIVKGENIQWKT